MTSSPANLPELVEKKAKIRMALREEFIKQVYNPHRHATGEGGYVFDPAHQRFMSMTTNRYRFFKPTVKTSFLGMALMVVPFVSIITLILNSKNKSEDLLRSGAVAYKDRVGKFV